MRTGQATTVAASFRAPSGAGGASRPSDDGRTAAKNEAPRSRALPATPRPATRPDAPGKRRIGRPSGAGRLVGSELGSRAQPDRSGAGRRGQGGRCCFSSSDVRRLWPYAVRVEAPSRGKRTILPLWFVKGAKKRRLGKRKIERRTSGPGRFGSRAGRRRRAAGNSLSPAPAPRALSLSSPPAEHHISRSGLLLSFYTRAPFRRGRGLTGVDRSRDHHGCVDHSFL